MRTATACFLLIVLGACDGAGDGEAGGAAALVASRFTPAPAWVVGAEVEDRRGALALVRGDSVRAPAGTDVRVTARFAVLRDDGAALVLPEPAIEAALLDGAVAWIDVDHTLWIDDGTRLRAVDDDVHGELATDPTGRWLAWAELPGERAGVWIAPHAGEAQTPRRVTDGLGVADRPVFVDDERLVVVGAAPGGVAGVWVVRYRERGARPVPITNATLRAGEPFGPTFVPPPAYHASMRVDADVLIYDDGEQVRRVPLTGVQP